MNRLDEIAELISQQKLPPVELWQPEVCADIDIVILNDGSWKHEGSKIERQALIKLFASILRKENGDHYLVTPIEKAKITVENTPFIVVSSERIDDRWFISNNLGDVKELDEACLLNITDEQNPKLIWRSDLEARVSQSVMYQWQIYALDHGGLVDGKLWLSCGTSRILIAVDE